MYQLLSLNYLYWAFIYDVLFTLTLNFAMKAPRPKAEGQLLIHRLV